MSLIERSQIGYTSHAASGPAASTSESESDKMFRITRVKNRFDEDSPDFESSTGFRNLSLSLEVGWTVDDKLRSCRFVPVSAWSTLMEVETHIIEVQVGPSWFDPIV
eukprot:763588-Hanusia_phi.AAC.4